MWFVESCSDAMVDLGLERYSKLPQSIYKNDMLRFSSLDSAAIFLTKLNLQYASIRLAHIANLNNLIRLTIRDKNITQVAWVVIHKLYNYDSYLSEIDNKFLQEHGS